MAEMRKSSGRGCGSGEQENRKGEMSAHLMRIAAQMAGRERRGKMRIDR